MKKSISVLFFLFVFVFVRAQTDFDIAGGMNIDTTISSKIILHAGYFFSSDAITNRFAQEYETHGFITDEMKDVISKKLADKNRLGAGFNQNLFFVFHPDSAKRNITAFVGISNGNYVGTEFPRDLFELFFRGNKNYAGKTANLSNFDYLAFDYRQFTAGMGEDFFLSHSKIYIGAAVNVVQGVRFTKIKSNHTTLFTQADGEYLDGDFDVTLQRDDSASAKYFPSEGTGISGDLFFSYETETGNKFTASIENYGSIKWNKFSSTVRIDTTFTFSGIDVSDLFNFNDSVSTHVTIDSTYYQNFLTDRKKERVTTQLPVNIRFAYTHPCKAICLDVTVGAGLLLYSNSVANYFVCGDYHLNKKNEIALKLSYGGYSKFNAGLILAHHFSRGYSLEAGSNYLSSMINYNQGTSQGAFVSFEKKF